MSKMAALSAMAGKAGGGMAAKWVRPSGYGCRGWCHGCQDGSCQYGYADQSNRCSCCLIPPLKKLVSPSTMVKLV